MDKAREEFEEVAKENGYDIRKNHNDGLYKNDATSDAWLFWRKSRAALVVELPTERDGYAHSFCCYEQDALFAALDRAGVKYE